MSVKVIEFKTKQEWEDALDNLNSSISFFQSWNWGEFETIQGHYAYRYGFIAESQDEPAKLVAMAQMFLIKAKRGKYLHVRNGPVFNQGCDKDTISQIISSLKEIATTFKCDFVRISPLLENKPENTAKFFSLGLKPSQMHDVDAEVTWLLNLEQTPDEILEGMRKSHRYLVKKSLKTDEIEIEKTQDINMLKNFWPIYEETFKRQGWHAYNFNYLKKEFEIFTKDNQVNLFLAKYQGKYIAASLFIYYRGQAYYHHSGSLSEFRNVPAMYKIHWESIIEAQRRELKTYNFFGIARDDDKNHPWAGLTMFKKGFGGYQQEWLHAMDIPIKMCYWFTHCFEKLERKKRGY